MRFESIELNGYFGLYQGTLKTNVKIVFGNNRITMISGPNGSGKSTLMSAMTIYPDPNTAFIPNQPASKEIVLTENGIAYKITCVHALTDKGARATAKAYIKKLENGQWIEYNPTGTITSYKDFIESEFEMDPNFVSLAALSTEDKGLVDKTPAERKKYVNTMIEHVGVYNNIHKVLTKRSSVYKSLINTLVSKIELIGNEEQVRTLLDSVNNRIDQAKKDRSSIEEIISINKAQIKILDPDSSIQNLYSSVHIELEHCKSSIRKYEDDLMYLFTNNEWFAERKDSLSNIDLISKQYANVSDRIKEVNIEIKSIETDLSKYFVEREEQTRAVQVKSNRINSLKSEFDYEYVLESISKYNKIKEDCEKIFQDIHIKNAINISKDEYILGLNTMNDIRDSVNAIQSSYYNNEIEYAMECILRGENLPKIIEEMEKKLKQEEESKEKVSNDYAYYNGLLDLTKILEKRPKKCKIDNCPFISESLSALKENPEESSMEAMNTLNTINSDIRTLQDDITIAKNCLSIINQINVLLRNIQNSKDILAKLPCGNLFLDKEDFIKSIAKGSRFDQVNSLYEYINYANIFEEYKKAIDILKDLKAEEKIYKSKVQSIDELSNDLIELNKKLDGIISKIDNSNEKINNYKSELEFLSKLQEDLDKLIVIRRGYDEVKNSIANYESQLNTISNNMTQIKTCLDTISDAETRLKDSESIISQLEEERNAYKYSLVMLKQYTEEMQQYEKSYAIIETIKEYSSPTKNGIQNLFIKVYMAQTLKLANELLSLFFDNRLSLLPYEIDATKFSIPCFSKFTGISTDDVSSCSRSEKAMIGLALSGALLKQASSKFNIMKIDEIDEGLDANNRLQFIKAVNAICDLLQIEQFIMISHSSELGLQNVDVIKLREGGAEVNGIDGNIIYNG